MAAQFEKYYFIAVQLEYKDNITAPQKMRTDIATLANRPKFKRNLFSFHKVIENQTLRFGLMACSSSEEDCIVKYFLLRVKLCRLELVQFRYLYQD